MLGKHFDGPDGGTSWLQEARNKKFKPKTDDNQMRKGKHATGHVEPVGVIPTVTELHKTRQLLASGTGPTSMDLDEADDENLL